MVYDALDGEAIRSGSDTIVFDEGLKFFRVIGLANESYLDTAAGPLPIKSSMIASVDIQTGE